MIETSTRRAPGVFQNPAKRTPPWLRALLTGLLVLLSLYVLSQLLAGLTPFLTAFAIAYFLNPSLNRFEVRVARWVGRAPGLAKRLNPRAISVLLTLSSVATIVVVVFLFAVPALLSQVDEVVRSLPRMVQSVKTRVEPLLERANLRYPDETSQIRKLIEDKVKEKIPELVAPVTRLIGWTLQSTVGFIALFIHLFVVPVFAGYLLFDMNRIRAGVVDYIPPRLRPWLVGRLHEVDALLSAFVRGQITVCFILAVFYGVTLSMLGVPLGLVVGFCIGFFNLVPFMAFIAGLPLALGIAWAGDCGSRTLFWITIVFLIGKFGDIYVLSPRIVGESLGLHSIVIILVLLLGGEYFGFAGLLLAVPVTAVASVFWRDITAAYKKSRFYGASPS